MRESGASLGIFASVVFQKPSDRGHAAACDPLLKRRGVSGWYPAMAGRARVDLARDPEVRGPVFLACHDHQ